MFWNQQIVSDGTIIGNIEAERLRLRRSAVVVGDVVCRSLSMDPDVSISGQLNVHKDSPGKLHLEGENAPEDEMADSNFDKVREKTSEKKSKDDDASHSKSGGGSSKNRSSTKKDGDSSDRDRREKDKEEKSKDDPSKKKSKEGDSADSSKPKAADG